MEVAGEQRRRLEWEDDEPDAESDHFGTVIDVNDVVRSGRIDELSISQQHTPIEISQANNTLGPVLIPHECYRQTEELGILVDSCVPSNLPKTPIFMSAIEDGALHNLAQKYGKHLLPRYGDQIIMTCVAMSYPDNSFAANSVRADREESEDFVNYVGF